MVVHVGTIKYLYATVVVRCVRVWSMVILECLTLSQLCLISFDETGVILHQVSKKERNSKRQARTDSITPDRIVLQASQNGESNQVTTNCTLAHLHAC